MKIHPDILCEQVGDEIVVLDSVSSSVVSIAGHTAVVVRRVLAGEMVAEDEPGVSELLAQGILIAETPGGLSRRSLMMGGAAIGAGGVLALSLPGAAMASSAAGLPAPVFTVIPNQTYISDLVGGDGGGATGFQFDRLRIDFERFDNRSEFPVGAVLEWGFATNGSFLQFLEIDSRYDWVAPKDNDDVPLYAEIPIANQLGDDRFTAFLRIRVGVQLSPVAGVEFFWND